MNMKTFKVSDIFIGYHPKGFRIDKTASAMDFYTRWEVEDGKWFNPKPVCFDSLPAAGWYKTDNFDWSVTEGDAHGH